MSAPDRTATAATTQQGGGLKRTLHVRHAVVTSVALIAPTGGILFLIIPIASNAGAATPLAVVLAFCVIFLIMNAVYRFSQRIAHAGSFFAFVRDSLGSRAGFCTGWLFLAFYPLIVIVNLTLFGATLEGIIVAHGGPEIKWWILMLIGLVFITSVAIIGIRLSIRTDLALLTFEIGVLLALAITILAKVEGGPIQTTVFDPSHGVGGFSGIALGAVFGLFLFVGFEAAAYLGEEAVEPTRTIPRALVTTLLVVGAIYIFFYYVATIGYGIDEVASKLPEDPAPWNTLGTKYWSSGATVFVDIAAVVALLASALACINGAARMTMALARDGLMPAWLARTSPRFHTPHLAIVAVFIVGLVTTLAVGAGFGPLPAFSLMSLISILNALLVYALIQVAVCVYFWRDGTFNPIWHFFVPVTAVAAIAYLFYKSISPTPAYPADLAIWVTMSWLIIGILVMLALSKLGPERFERAVTVIGEGAEVDDRLDVDLTVPPAAPGRS